MSTYVKMLLNIANSILTIFIVFSIFVWIIDTKSNMIIFSFGMFITLILINVSAFYFYKNLNE